MSVNSSFVSFEKLFKIILLIYFGYLLVLINVALDQMERNADMGRYQFWEGGPHVLDTKTGEVTKFRPHPRY